jgi:hypothetical protein
MNMIIKSFYWKTPFLRVVDSVFLEREREREKEREKRERERERERISSIFNSNF